MTAPLFESTITSLPLINKGKVRDIYAIDADKLLIVTTDRLSAFDVILPDPIPRKGEVLQAVANFWFAKLGHIVPNQLTGIDPETVVAENERKQVRSRAVVVKRLKPLPIEAVVRGYVIGSGWKDYQETGAIFCIALPAGLRMAAKLPAPIFTPATKAAEGHDENISFEHAAELVGLETMTVLRDLSLAIYTAAAEHALARGIIIADTKFEFGLPEGAKEKLGRVWTQPMLIDEALTPDSSRFWPVDGYAPGRAQKSYDKQFLREYLETLVTSGTWNKTPPGPELPPQVVEGTLGKYREAIEKLTR